VPMDQYQTLACTGSAVIQVDARLDLLGDLVLSFVARRTNWTVATYQWAGPADQDAFRRLRSWFLQHRRLYEGYAAVLDDGLIVRIDTDSANRPLLDRVEDLLSQSLCLAHLEREVEAVPDTGSYQVHYLSPNATLELSYEDDPSDRVVNLFSMSEFLMRERALRSLFPQDETAFASIALKLEWAGISTLGDLMNQRSPDDAIARAKLSEMQAELFETWVSARSINWRARR